MVIDKVRMQVFLTTVRAQIQRYFFHSRFVHALLFTFPPSFNSGYPRLGPCSAQSSLLGAMWCRCLKCYVCCTVSNQVNFVF